MEMVEEIGRDDVADRTELVERPAYRVVGFHRGVHEEAAV